jgi:hypothetical protein
MLSQSRRENSKKCGLSRGKAFCSGGKGIEGIEECWFIDDQQWFTGGGGRRKPGGKVEGLFI